MTTKQDAMERAKQLASEGHCRYCDRRTDPRLKCVGDIEDSAAYIADALLAFRKEGLEKAASQFEDMVIRRGIRPEFAVKVIRKLEEGG